MTYTYTVTYSLGTLADLNIREARLDCLFSGAYLRSPLMWVFRGIRQPAC